MAKQPANKTPPTITEAPTITPVRVICRVTGAGRRTAERIVQQLGDKAEDLAKLYQANDVAGIRDLIAKQPSTQHPVPSTGKTAKE